MKFQGSGFSIDVPEGAMDGSAYVFAFPEVGEFPPIVTIRFELGDDVDMAAHMAEVRANLQTALPHAAFSSAEDVRSRGDWQYFTHVVDFGEPETRFRQKELYLLVRQPKPTLYIFSGTDFADNFANFEPLYDAIVRSFQPNAEQRVN